MAGKKPRRFTLKAIAGAMKAAKIPKAVRAQVLETLEEKSSGRPPDDDARLLEGIAHLVHFPPHLRPFTAAKQVAPDLRTAKRIYRKYMADRDGIEERYRQFVERILALAEAQKIAKEFD